MQRCTGTTYVSVLIYVFAYTRADISKIMEALTIAEKYLESARSSPCKVMP